MVDNLNRISALRGKLNAKVSNKKNQEGCPTGVLLYIATGRQAPHDVNPWYSQIKEKCDGANRHNSEIHQDFIFGMYPELEKASKFFVERIDADKSAIHSDETLAKIEQETLKMFNLSDTYQISSQSKEQSERIENRTKQTLNNIQNREIEELDFSVLKNLGHAIKRSTSDRKTIFEAIENLSIVSCMLKDGEEKVKESKIDKADYLKKYPTMNKIYNMAEDLFAMQKENILDKDMNVIDTNTFNKSSLVKNFTVGDKEFDLNKAYPQAKKDTQAEI